MEILPTLVVLKGGEAFDSYDHYLESISKWDVRFFEDRTGWKTTFYRELSDRFRVLIPDFPTPGNARYAEWKMFFEKFAPDLDPETTTYVGHSLGGIFLAKYLSENDFHVKNIHLVAAPFGRCGDFELPEDLSKLSKNASNIHLWHSKDDPVVDFADAEKYASVVPGSKLHVFEDRKHFNGERFDELA